MRAMAPGKLVGYPYQLVVKMYSRFMQSCGFLVLFCCFCVCVCVCVCGFFKNIIWLTYVNFSGLDVYIKSRTITLPVLRKQLQRQT